MGELLTVNVGEPRQIGVRGGRPVMSAIVKAPVAGRIPVRGVNLDGDDQADRRVHGGPDKAVYAYATEDTAWWAQVLERQLGPGVFGENLTTRGIDVSGAVVGQHWHVGTAELEVCQPRQPCFKLGMVFGNPKMLRAFALADRPGAYLRIVRDGEMGAGDTVELGPAPAHGVTVAMVARAIVGDDSLLERVAAVPELPRGLAEWLGERAAGVRVGTA